MRPKPIFLLAPVLCVALMDLMQAYGPSLLGAELFQGLGLTRPLLFLGAMMMICGAFAMFVQVRRDAALGLDGTFADAEAARDREPVTVGE